MHNPSLHISVTATSNVFSNLCCSIQSDESNHVANLHFTRVLALVPHDPAAGSPLFLPWITFERCWPLQARNFRRAADLAMISPRHPAIMIWPFSNLLKFLHLQFFSYSNALSSEDSIRDAQCIGTIWSREAVVKSEVCFFSKVVRYVYIISVNIN